MDTRFLVGLFVLQCHVTGSDVMERAATDPVAQLRAENQQLSSQVTHLSSQLTALQSTVDQLNQRLHGLEETVAFSVRFRHDDVGELAEDTVGYPDWKYLKFDYVQYQTGGVNYNKTSGFFTAPSSGTYAFFLTMQRNSPTSNECLEAYIIRNTNTSLSVVSACPGGYTSSSNMALTTLVKGDTVRVQTRYDDRILGYVHTTFSGYKIN